MIDIESIENCTCCGKVLKAEEGDCHTYVAAEIYGAYVYSVLCCSCFVRLFVPTDA